MAVDWQTPPRRSANRAGGADRLHRREALRRGLRTSHESYHAWCDCPANQACACECECEDPVCSCGCDDDGACTCTSPGGSEDPGDPTDPGCEGAACNQGVGNGDEGCDPGNSNQGDPASSNDENGGEPGEPGKSNGNGKAKGKQK